jgi:SAM-dependent methyltransferase
VASPDPLTRFSDRVADYVRWRPGYPPAVIEALCRHAGLRQGARVADLGSGTGIFSAMLLEAGAAVQAVEPNAEMRAAAEHALGARPGFSSVAGRAEATGLAPASVDLVCAAQAFHWFDQQATRQECRRILRPGGSVALLWNERLVDATPFLAAYEQLLRRFAVAYAQVDHRRIDAEAIAAFFAPSPVTTVAFPNQQSFAFAGVRGRLLSSSYVPAAGDPRHGPMLAELERIFHQHQSGGEVAFRYTTHAHIGVQAPLRA